MTNKTEKMTNRKALTFCIDLLNGINSGDGFDFPNGVPAEVVEKLTAMIAALDKKSTAERKPTAKQGENAAVRAAIVEFINENAKGDGFTCSDLLKVCPAVEGKSNQYVSAILRQAVLAGEVSKGTVKRRTYFAPVGQYAAEVEGE